MMRNSSKPLAGRPTGQKTAIRRGSAWSGVCAVLLVVAVFLLIHQIFVSRAHPDALYMDSLRLLYQLDQWQTGRLSTFEFWGGSSHRGFINQLFLWANVSLFDLDLMLANRLTGVVIATVACILGTSWVLDIRGQKGPRSLWLEGGVALAVAALCFSWAGYELLTLDLGLPLWTKNLAFVVFFWGHARLLSGHSRHPAVLVVAMTLAAPVIVLVCGMGWNYAFVCAVLAVQAFSFIPLWRAPGRWTGVLPSLALAGSMVAYLCSGTVTDASIHEGRLNIGSDVPALVLYALGSTAGYPQAVLLGRLPLVIIAVIGGLLLGVGVTAAVSWMRRGAPGSRLPMLLMLYGALVAVSVTLARGADGPFGVMASRYYMDLVLGLIGVIWLAMRELHAAPRRLGYWRIVVPVMLLALLVSQSLTALQEWRASPYRAAIFVGMNKAVRLSVPDEEAAVLLQAPLDHARKGAQVMRARQLGQFTGTSAACSTASVAYAAGWHQEEGSSRWSSADATLELPACGCTYFADLYVPDSMPAKHVRVIADEGQEQEVSIRPGESIRTRLGAERVEIEVVPVTIPRRDQPGSADTRELGVLLTGFSVNCAVP